MSRNRILIVLVIVLIGVLVGLWKWPRSQPRQTTPDRASPPQSATPAVPETASASSQDVVIPDLPGANLTPEDKKNIGKIVQAFNAPIDFWGRVIDQHGDPVPKAAIHYSFADKYFKDGTKRTGRADDQGFFSLNEGRGAGVYVSVYKERYYGTPRSAGSFGYGMPVGGKPPSRDNPAIFVLHKMGETEPLIFAQGSVRLPRDGTPTDITLRRPRPAVATGGKGDLQVELWSGYQPPPPHGQRYDWRVRISVPNGGLVERVGPFDFTAPQDGYLPAFEFAMPATTDRWQSRIDKEFFLQLRDGYHARVKLGVHAGGDIFVVLESYLNPKPGSRNLEFDPAKLAKP